MYSQNNIYQINDKVFEYYDECFKLIHDPKVLLMTDTLFNKAAAVNDVKAQCMALYLKSDYYYYAKDTLRLRESIGNMRPFIIKTPYLQYYFGALNRIIAAKISNYLYVEALQEIESYQKEALFFDNSYAIAFSYRHFGNLYSVLQEYEMASENYLKGIDYLNKYGNPKEAYIMYSSLGKMYKEQKKYAESMIFYKKAMNLTTDSRSIITQLQLADLSFEINQPDSAYYYYSKADSLIKINPLKGNNIEIYNEIRAKYYCYIKEYEKALLLSDSLLGIVQLNTKIQIYRGLEDYKNLSFWLEKKVDYISNRSNEEFNTMISKNSIRFENTQLEAEKNKLALQNSTMRIARMEHEKGLLEAEQERNKLSLHASELKLKNIDLINQKHEAEIEHSRAELIRQKERAAALEELDSLNRTILYIVISSFVILLVIFAAYSFQRRKSIKRLKHERNIALVAKEEAMNAREEAEHAREEAEVAREEAEVARVEAELANRQKTIFFENMSHEIRTPLNAIVGFSEVLNSGEDLDLTKEEREEYLGLIFKNSDLLTTLVNDVLDLSRL
ncbi:MAG: histidine kinase dimerization/phospho-acceptor domain-containing protein, partial [Phocaeicola sp.]